MPPDVRYRIMSSIRSTRTKPEVVLSAAAKEAFPKARVVLNASDIPGRPDVYIPSLRLLLFADGCLFHGCPQHCRIPHNNRKYWSAKIAKNIARDNHTRRRLRYLGYSVWRIWEHDCMPSDGKRLVRKLSVIGTIVRRH